VTIPELPAPVLPPVRRGDETRERLNIARYTMFDLRDADSSKADLMYQFGLMRDDYTPKPAFEAYRGLIDELGSKSPS